MEGNLWHFLTVSFTPEIKATSIVLNYLGSTESLRKMLCELSIETFSYEWIYIFLTCL